MRYNVRNLILCNLLHVVVQPFTVIVGTLTILISKRSERHLRYGERNPEVAVLRAALCFQKKCQPQTCLCKAFSCSFTADMPRYCAVKVCRNRGGTASRQDNKRISFYPYVFCCLSAASVEFKCLFSSAQVFSHP